MTAVIKHWWPSALTLAVVLYATLDSEPTGDISMVLFPGADKVIHCIMMGGLTGAIIFDRTRAHRAVTTRLLLWLGAGMGLFCVADEVAQDLMCNGRTFDLWDWVADAAGVVIALFLAPPVCRRIFRCPRQDR